MKNLDGPAETLKTLADGKRAYLKDGKAYDLFKGGALTSFETAKEVAKNRGLQGVKRSPSDYRGMGDEYLAANAVAALNHEPMFVLNNKKYHTNTGRAVSSGIPNSALKGLKNLDIEKDKFHRLRGKTLISEYEKVYGKCDVFAFIDKSKARLIVHRSQ